MRKILPVVLVLLGVTEIILAIRDIKMPIMIAAILGVVFIALGIKTLIANLKRK